MLSWIGIHVTDKWSRTQACLISALCFVVEKVHIYLLVTYIAMFLLPFWIQRPCLSVRITTTGTLRTWNKWHANVPLSFSKKCLEKTFHYILFAMAIIACFLSHTLSHTHTHTLLSLTNVSPDLAFKKCNSSWQQKQFEVFFGSENINFKIIFLPVEHRCNRVLKISSTFLFPPPPHPHP